MGKTATQALVLVTGLVLVTVLALVLEPVPVVVLVCTMGMKTRRMMRMRMTATVICVVRRPCGGGKSWTHDAGRCCGVRYGTRTVCFLRVFV